MWKDDGFKNKAMVGKVRIARKEKATRTNEAMVLVLKVLKRTSLQKSPLVTKQDPTISKV